MESNLGTFLLPLQGYPFFPNNKCLQQQKTLAKSLLTSYSEYMPAHRTNAVTRYFHICSKSVRKNLFVDEDDYSVFLGYLKEYLTSPKDQEDLQKTFKIRGKEYKGVPHQPKNYYEEIELIAYSLAEDHFHLLLHEKKHGKLEKFLRSLATRYAIYFNKRYDRKGSLFHGPYKSVELTDPTELVLLSKHLHQEKGNNSFDAYQSQDVAWLHPEPTIKLFSKLKDIKYHTVETYEKFVTDYALTQEDVEILESVSFDTISATHLHTILEPQGLEKDAFLETQVPAKRSKKDIFRFVGVSFALYVALFTLGLQNVRSTVAQVTTPPPLKSDEIVLGSSDPEPTPEVVTTEAYAEISNVGTSSAVLGPHTQIESHRVERDELEGIVEAANSDWELVTVTSDINAYVNIRKAPTIASEVIEKAQAGDVYDMAGYDNGGWYEVILENGTHGFISAQFIAKLQ